MRERNGWDLARAGAGTKGPAQSGSWGFFFRKKKDKDLEFCFFVLK